MGPVAARPPYLLVTAPMVVMVGQRASYTDTSQTRSSPYKCRALTVRKEAHTTRSPSQYSYRHPILSTFRHYSAPLRVLRSFSKRLGSRAHAYDLPCYD